MRNRFLYCALLIFFLFCLVGWLGNWTRLMKSGHEAYWHQDYDVAVEAFEAAVLDKPNNPITHHNLGTALYKTGRYKQAAAAFQTSLLKGDVDDKAAVYYNLGNAQFQMYDFSAAVQSYEDSLRLNPHDADTKHNLALALKLLKEQQEYATQQQMDSRKKQDSAETEPSNLSKSEALQLLERLSKNENLRRQKILKQQLKSGYRREKDW